MENGDDEQDDIRLLLDLSSKRSSTVVFEGYSTNDKNFHGNLLVVESPDSVYSIPRSDITDEEKAGDGRIRVHVRVGAQVFRTTSTVARPPLPQFTAHGDGVLPPRASAEMQDASAQAIEVYGPTDAMEKVPPPTQLDTSDMPASATEFVGAAQKAQRPPLSSVGANWRNSCAGADSFENNCAHFLSDAFIRAGYTELMQWGARCYTSAKRPLRAREMWSWFQLMAVNSSNTLQRNTGWWAVFQLDERVYWGGHVVLLDSNSWVYYGTGWYGRWAQYLYQW